MASSGSAGRLLAAIGAPTTTTVVPVAAHEVAAMRYGQMLPAPIAVAVAIDNGSSTEHELRA